MSLEKAIEAALQNPIKPRGRTSISRTAAILTDGFRTFTGLNSYKTHPLQAIHSKKVGEPEKIYCHAEIAVIAKALRECRFIPFYVSRKDGLSDMTLYVARVLRDGSPANARPCVGCMSAIAEFGIKEVHWTT